MKLHKLIVEGNGDSEEEEADVIRDEMDGPWRLLNPQEVSQLNHISAWCVALTGSEDHRKDLFEKLNPISHSPVGNKVRVDIEEVKALQDRRRQINRLNLDDIQWFENGQLVHVDPKVLADYKYTGLNVVDFVDTDFYKEGWDSDKREPKV